MKQTGISKIILTVGGKEITLTPDEVRDLKEALDKMYPEAPKVVREYVPYPRPFASYPHLWWNQPFASYAAGSNGLASLEAKVDEEGKIGWTATS